MSSIVVNDVRRGLYLDSVALMRMSRTVATSAGVIECGIMMGTPANMRIMADAGVLANAGRGAGPGDLVIAIAAVSQAVAEAALAEARALLETPKVANATGAAWVPRTLRAAVIADPSANLALISVPGAFAAAEARKALQRGLHVMMFSDNVPVADEVALKRMASARGLLMMGPDCGTAIINGTPLGFANVVPRGDIGIIGASGTGIQEVSCLLANNGRGISHAIGTGGRDLKSDVGGITTLLAIDVLDTDPATKHIIIISKPASANVERVVLARVAQSNKQFTICFLGGTEAILPPNAKLARTLETAADLALGSTPTRVTRLPLTAAKGKYIRGLFAGGTLCAEAQIELRAEGLACASNVPLPGHAMIDAAHVGHTLIDLGDDAYTQGRPHPMIEPAVRDVPLLAALSEPNVGCVLIDVVLGFGAHADPAGHIASVLARAPTSRPLIITSVTGTAGDPQGLARQQAKLRDCGVVVAVSNAEAARLAARYVKT